VFVQQLQTLSRDHWPLLVALVAMSAVRKMFVLSAGKKSNDMILVHRGQANYDCHYDVIKTASIEQLRGILFIF
jgi:coenzyme F420-reducing hydrogenase delta subunit